VALLGITLGEPVAADEIVPMAIPDPLEPASAPVTAARPRRFFTALPFSPGLSLNPGTEESSTIAEITNESSQFSVGSQKNDRKALSRHDL